MLLELGQRQREQQQRQPAAAPMTAREEQLHKYPLVRLKVGAPIVAGIHARALLCISVSPRLPPLFVEAWNTFLLLRSHRSDYTGAQKRSFLACSPAVRHNALTMPFPKSVFPSQVELVSCSSDQRWRGSCWRSGAAIGARLGSRVFAGLEQKSADQIQWSGTDTYFSSC